MRGRSSFACAMGLSINNFRLALVGASLVLVACGSSSGGTGGSGASTGVGGIGGSGGPGGNGFPPGPLDLCDGLVQDLAAHPMTPLAKPALGQTATDAEFGTKIRRITSVSASTRGTPAAVPLYSTVAAWNADETRLILLNLDTERHELYDGKSYAFIRSLAEINPPDVEQVFWHTTDPDVFFYADGSDFVRYHVSDARAEVLTTFTNCSGGATNGTDPMFSAFDSNRFAFKCGSDMLVYEVSSNSVISRKPLVDENPPQMAPSGTLTWLSDSGRVTDASLNVVRTIDLKEPFGHSSLGRWPTGEDTWNGQVFDDGPMGNSDIGNLVTFDLTRGTSKVIIGPKTGYPYPPDSHVSAMAFRQPGWAVVSTFGKTSGAGLLDEEILIADTVSGKVCRAGRHRSWGKDDPTLDYWAEPHAVPSPTGTRIFFASDWSNSGTVDAYVLELPSYHP
jgi:hypothetical protein